MPLTETTSPETARDQASLISIIKDLRDDALTLGRQEIALAKREMAYKVTRLGRNAVFLGIGAVVALYGLFFVLLSLNNLLFAGLGQAGFSGSVANLVRAGPGGHDALDRLLVLDAQGPARHAQGLARSGQNLGDHAGGKGMAQKKDPMNPANGVSRDPETPRFLGEAIPFRTGPKLEADAPACASKRSNKTRISTRMSGLCPGHPRGNRRRHRAHPRPYGSDPVAPGPEAQAGQAGEEHVIR